MPYITGGQISDSRPWTPGKVVEIFWSFILGIIFFFKTLFPFIFPDGSGGSRGSRSSGSRTTVPGRRIGGLPRSGGAAPPPCGASGG